MYTHLIYFILLVFTFFSLFFLFFFLSTARLRSLLLPGIVVGGKLLYWSFLFHFSASIFYDLVFYVAYIYSRDLFSFFFGFGMIARVRGLIICIYFLFFIFAAVWAGFLYVSFYIYDFYLLLNSFFAPFVTMCFLFVSFFCIFLFVLVFCFTFFNIIIFIHNLKYKSYSFVAS